MTRGANGALRRTAGDSEEELTEFPDEHDAFVGTIFADRYEIVSIIGKGGMSVVYKANHLLMKNLVAVKMLLPHTLLSPTNLKRFQQEAQAASALNHPNVITVHDLGVTPGGLPYLVMEYVDGAGLSDIIRKEGKLDPARCLDMFICACDALAAAHDKGIIHRDLKPSNIMIVTGGDGKDLVKIVDFGIAKLMPTEGEEAQRLTQTGDVFGSPLYMSPEQCLAKPLDARADVYSLGCVIYETLTGKPPLVGGSILETMYKHMHEVPAGLGEAIGDTRLREQLDAVFFKATAKDSEQRYQNMRELKAALENVRAGADKGLLARLTSLWETSRLKRAPKRARSTQVVGLAVAAIALACLSVWALNTLFATPAHKYVEMSWTSVQEAPPPPSSNYAKKERLAELFLDLASNKTGAESAELVPRLQMFGQFRKQYHKWQGAAACFEQALKIANEIGATKDGDYYQAQLGLADCYYQLGRYSDAAPLYRSGVENLNAISASQDLAEPAHRLGECYLRTRLLPGAELYLRWSVDVLEQTRVEGGALDKSPEYALTLSNLADVYRLDGKLDKAENGYTKAIDVWKKFEEQAARKNLTLSLYYLAEVRRLKGNANEAARSYQEALDAADRAFGPQHPYVANILYHYSDVLWQQNHWLESLQTRARANTIRRTS